MNELPVWATDAVMVETEVHLDWRDRLRVLVRGQLWVKSQTFTEHKPGRVESVSDVAVAPIRLKTVGYYTEEAQGD
jgi:hypothetical protein